MCRLIGLKGHFGDWTQKVILGIIEHPKKFRRIFELLFYIFYPLVHTHKQKEHRIASEEQQVN